MSDQPEAIGRVCPYVRQQCRLSHGCALFATREEVQAGALTAIRAYNCSRGGAFVFADEVAAGYFKRIEHPDGERWCRYRGELAKLHRKRATAAQFALPLYGRETSPAPAGTPTPGASPAVARPARTVR